MPEFAFHFWPGAAVVLAPRRVLLRGAGIGQLLLVATDPDAAALGGVGALSPQWAVGARRPEGGRAIAVLVAPDRGGGLAGVGEVGDEVGGDRRNPDAPALTTVSVITSLCGSIAIWPL